MSSPVTAVPARMHSTWPVTLRVALIATTAVTLVLLAFMWPSYSSSVQNLPVTISGTEQATRPIESKLTGGGQFEVTRVADRAEAVDSIRRHDSYGGIVVTGRRIEVLTASAASPVVSQALSGVAQGMLVQLQGQALAQASGSQDGSRSAATSPQVVVTDVVPLSQDDPRGTVLGVAGLPMTMGGMIGGILISLLVVGHWRRAAAILAYGVVASLVLTLVLHAWFGALTGNFALEWLVVGLSLIATASIIVGFQGLIGPPGIGVGAIITMFIGNPLSSAAAPPEFLPWHWGTIGQWFVPGATSALLRLTSYFPDAPTARYWWALILWAAIGMALLLFGHFRDQQAIALSSGLEPDEPAADERRVARRDDSVHAAGRPVGASALAGSASEAPLYAGGAVGGPGSVSGTPRLAGGTADSTWSEPDALRPADGAARDTGSVSQSAWPADGTAGTAGSGWQASQPAGLGLDGLVSVVGGRAVANAQVTVTDLTGRQVGYASTDAAGRYAVSLPAPDTYLVIVAAAHLSPVAARVHAGDGRTRHDVLISGQGSLRGRVRRADAGSVAGVGDALLTLTDVQGSILASTRTTPEGDYTLDGLEPGAYVLTAYSPTAGTQARSVEVPQSGSAAHDLDLAPITGPADTRA